MKNKRCWGVLIFSVCIMAACASNPSLPWNHRKKAMLGLVYDGERKCVMGAAVSLDGRVVTHTDSQGCFILPAVKRKDHLLEVHAAGHQSASRLIHTPGGEEVLVVTLLTPEQMLERAVALIDENNLQDALDLTREAIDIDSHCSEACFLQGIILYRMERWNEAAECLLRVRQQNVYIPEITLFSARIKEQQKAAAPHPLPPE